MDTEAKAWSKVTRMYDPPEGWKYGFPKPYRPLRANERIETTLVRDGYPKKLTKLARMHTRFWVMEEKYEGK